MLTPPFHPDPAGDPMRWLLTIALAVSTAVADPPKADRPKAAPPPVRVFFGPKKAKAEDGLLRNLLAFIDSAETTLHGSVHEVDMIVVAERLAARADAGVEVQVVVEADWWGSSKTKAAKQVLEGSKVKVTPDTKKSGLMHNKFFVADGKRVWTGSTNLTETCLLFNANNAVWVEDANVAANFETEFREEAKGKFGKRGSGKPNTPNPTVQVDADTTVTTLFSPEDKPLPAIIAQIDAAEKTLDIACFVFSSAEVSAAVAKAHARGVKARVLLDNAFSSKAITARWKCVPFDDLTKAGVSCKYDDELAKLHHKFLVVDDATVVTGSFNLSVNAANENDENVLVIRSAAVAKKYATEFTRLWAQYSGKPGEVPPVEQGDEDDGK
jgi:phosphatidylserine/phosphatidylglycerophosphate/cardiolipin synthase-like enzyme